MNDPTIASAAAGRSLLQATMPFTKECRGKSWWHVASTFLLLAMTLALAAMLPWWPARLAASVVGGLMFVRGFILFHDFMHGSLLKGSLVANGLFSFFGLVVLTPPRSWRSSHNSHHAHVGKPDEQEHIPPSDSITLATSEIGSFPLMSTAMWEKASRWRRLRYRVSRHPLTILCAYVTIFLFTICLAPLAVNPRRNWDGALAILVHVGLIASLWAFAGFSVALFAFVVPYAISAALGAYLFYAQHNFPEMRLVPADEWNYYRGSLESSSYMKLGPVMAWLTGNIGYHHIHHLNPHIAFYRLPEAMRAIAELQHPPITTLHPRDILACLRLNLWDGKKERLVSFSEAAGG